MSCNAVLDGCLFHLQHGPLRLWRYQVSKCVLCVNGSKVDGKLAGVGYSIVGGTSCVRGKSPLGCEHGMSSVLAGATAFDGSGGSSAVAPPLTTAAYIGGGAKAGSCPGKIGMPIGIFASDNPKAAATSDSSSASKKSSSASDVVAAAAALSASFFRCFAGGVRKSRTDGDDCLGVPMSFTTVLPRHTAAAADLIVSAACLLIDILGAICCLPSMFKLNVSLEIRLNSRG